MAKILNSRTALLTESHNAWRSLLLCQALALGISPLLPLTASAETAAPSTLGNTTILPTDIVPLTDREAFKTPIGELLQLKMMQRLPSRFYCSSSVEVSGRDETNPFQFPTKRALLAQLPKPAVWRTLGIKDQLQLYNVLGECARSNGVFRVLPNFTAGWTVTPHTRIFTNYFLIRDQMQTSNRLNTVIHSYAIGFQQDWALGAKGSAQFEFQGRSLWQLHQQTVFDFLPGLTLSYIATPRTVLFANALMQMRGKSVCEVPTKELDPFYTWGALYQKNGWTFSASTTFVQNFREPFHHFATIPKNNYVLISDYEISRRVLKQYPGLQAFMRAEPIWNFHAHNTPSLSGMDFRIFGGMRVAVAKQALTSTLQQIREQLKEEGETPQNGPGKPSAQIPLEDEITLNPQPIHGFLERDSLAETCQLPESEQPLIAEENNQAPEESPSAPLVAEKETAGDTQPQDAAGNSASQPEIAAAPVRTLEAIAAATGASKTPSSSQNNIMDLSSAQLDWNDLEAKQAQAPASTGQEDIHSIVARAAQETNSLAQQDRFQKIRNLSEQQEKEYRLAMAPLPMPVPVKAPVAPVPARAAIAPVPVKTAVAPVPVRSNRRPASASIPPAAPLKAQATAFMPEIKPTCSNPVTARLPLSAAKPTTGEKQQSNLSTLITAQPSGLKHTTARPSEPTIPSGTGSSLALVPQLSAPALSRSEKALEPLQSSAASSQTLSANLAPRAIKHEKRTAEPVPLSTRLAAAPNTVPAPVASKLSGAAENKAKSASENIAALASAPTAGKNTVMRHIDEHGLIPLAEARLDKATPVLAANSSRPSTGANPAQAKSTRLPAEKPALIATAVMPQQIHAAIPPMPARTLSKSDWPEKQVSASGQPTRSGFGYVSRPIMPPPMPKPVVEESSIAVSELSESEITSPKIAMAVYESWQSPVLDDPLIGSQEPQTENVKWVSGAASTAGTTARKHKQSSEKRTDMRLIPPFPAANRESKDGPLQNLQVPVLPIR